MSQLFDKAGELKDLKTLKQDMDAIVKELNAKTTKVEEELVTLMQQEECTKFDYSGLTFKMTSKIFATTKTGKKPELISALKANGLGDLVKEDVNAAALRSAILEQIEENQHTLPQWLKGLVTILEKPVISVRKGKANQSTQMTQTII